MASRITLHSSRGDEMESTNLDEEKNYEESNPYRGLGLACADCRRWRLFLVR
jgi:hypothetical protein